VASDVPHVALRVTARRGAGPADLHAVRRRAAALPVALTGTPGVGKSAVARRLRSRWTAVEVSRLAAELGAARRLSRGVEVDLPKLRATVRASGVLQGIDVVVGHLAHLLPVREAIVLRCQPVELVRRLRRAGRGTARDQRENYVSETLDLVLVEAVTAGVPVYEVDTTHRSVEAVAREVDRRLRHGGPPRAGVVDWLAKRSVTAHLLDAPG